MSALVVDTSVWIAFFRGESRPGLERALAAGLVVLAPVVVAELLSARMQERARRDLEDLLSDLPLHPTPFQHWTAVGALRARAARAGVTVSTPDAHIAQCARDIDGGRLWSEDAVFTQLARVSDLRLFTAD